MSDLIERLGKLQDSCSKQELHLLDTDYVWELAGRTADEIERLRAGLKQANSGFEKYERKYYLQKDETERLQARVEALEDLVCIHADPTGTPDDEHDLIMSCYRHRAGAL